VTTGPWHNCDMWDGGWPRCILRAVSCGLALVFSTFGFMGLEELCIFAILLSGTTIQDGGIGVRSDVINGKCTHLFCPLALIIV